MTLDEAKRMVGRPVEYVAFTGAGKEYGIITDTGPGYVMVQFGGCSYSRSIHPKDLRAIEAIDVEIGAAS